VILPVVQHQVAWFTGLSGAGKTTISLKAVDLLQAKGLRVLTLDGDVVRSRLHKHLGFSPEDIKENNRLIVGLCHDSLAEYDVILVPIISPFRDSRAHAKKELGSTMAEVYVKVSLQEAAIRDPKGLYQDQQSGKIQNLIGVDGVPYEHPEHPDLNLDTERMDPDSCAAKLVDCLLGIGSQRSITRATIDNDDNSH